MLPHLLLVQAGPTDLDLQNRITGRLDLPLTADAESSTHKILAPLGPLSVDLVVSAPCQAAVQTARILASSGKLRVKVDKRLVNIDYGLWHGKSLEELKRTQPDVYRQWVQSPNRIQAPGGESPVDVQQRLDSFVEWCLRKHGTQRIAVVVPAAIARTIAEWYFPADPDEKRFGDPTKISWAWLPEENVERPATTLPKQSLIDNFSAIWGL